MLQSWEEFIPEIRYLEVPELREKVEETFEEARQIGNWTFDELATLPFSVNIPGVTITLREHMRSVVYMTNQAYQMMLTCYGENHPEYQWNYPYLMAGALLHDVGKIIEYGKDEDGRPYVNERGKLMHHFISGSCLAAKHGLPDEVVHMIAVHVQDGVKKYRSPEAAIVNKIDLLNFDPFKAFAGLPQNF